jgi:biopolymer transport protein ExbD
MLKKRKVSQAEIPTSSMADIAFLLLLFFLVATVIDVDTGIGLTLPDYSDEPPQPLRPERLIAILINENGDVLIDGNQVALFQIKNTVKPRIESKIELPSGKKLVISLKTDRKTNYNSFIQALDQIKLSYIEVKDEYSLTNFGKKYKDLSPEEQKIIKEKIPEIISIAEPEMVRKS